MSVDDAIVELIRQTLNEEVEIPDEDEMERIAQMEIAEHMDDHLLPALRDAISNDSRVGDLIETCIQEYHQHHQLATKDELLALKAELLGDIHVRTVRYQINAVKDRLRIFWAKFLRRRKPNVRKVALLAVLF